MSRKDKDSPLNPIIWRRFKNTKEFHLSVNGIHARAWKDLPLEMKILESLYLDVVLAAGNWNLYRTTVHNCAPTLERVYLVDVSPKDSHGVEYLGVGHGEESTSDQTGKIDLGFLSICKHLTSLTLKCQHDFGNDLVITDVDELPKSLEQLNFAWGILTPYQIIRTLVAHRKLKQFEIDYCFGSEGGLGRFLCLLRMFLKLKLIKARQITIVDHKVKFQNALRRLHNLQKYLGTKVQYHDDELTMLEINLTAPISI